MTKCVGCGGLGLRLCSDPIWGQIMTYCAVCCGSGDMDNRKVPQDPNTMWIEPKKGE